MVSLANIIDRMFRLLDIHDIDTEDHRRQKTLNIILVGLAIISVPALLMFLTIDLLGYSSDPVAVSRLYLGFGLYALIMLIVYQVNKRNSLIASTLFLLLFTSVISVSDSYIQIVSGRGLLLFSIPIMISSVLLSPYASFIFATICSGIISIIAFSIDIIPDVGAVSGFYILATISWLMSRSQKNAFDKLSAINVELDNRVEERTRELSDANQRLQNLSEMKTRFVSTATHELRTPLTSMKGYLELISSEDLSLKVSEYLNVVSRNMARLEALTDDLLDQQRIEEGRLEVIKTRFCFFDLIKEIEEELTGLLSDSDHVIEISLPDEPVFLYGDQLRLHQVFLNLLDNAKKYSPNGSLIRLEATIDTSNMLVAVSDEGIGMSEADQAELFKPFPNIDRPIFTKQSVGLGLSISKGIIDAHDGRIWVESNGKGEGSTVTFSLPLPKDH